MASVDLSGGDAQQIRGAYSNYLGRNASDDEVSGWLSGSYGGGGLNDWINQISNSDEARRRQAPQVPNQPPLPTGVQTIGQNPQNNHGYSGGDGPSDDFSQQINQSYQTNLGRSASADEIAGWWSGNYGWGDRNNLAGIQRGIASSEEASRHRAATPQTSYSSTPYTGFGNWNNDYSAFNTARLQDPGKSAKDAFAMISNQAPPPPFHSKAALAQWFNTYIAPGMNALGHKIVSVNEDGFTFSNPEGTFFVDFGQNAGAQPGSMQQRLQWLASPADDATRKRYAGGATTPTPGAVPISPIVPGVGVPAGPQPQQPSLARSASGDYEGAGVDTTPAAAAGPSGPEWDNFANQIAYAYQTYLGRPASPDEIQSWFNGTYGYGSGVAGLPAILQAIQNSPEARARGGVSTPTAPPPSTTGGGGGNLPSNQYSDAYTQLLETLIKSRIGSLQGGYDDSSRLAYQNALQQRAQSLSSGNAQLDQLMKYLQDRFINLQGPGYTGAENEVIRTGALDPIERDRSAARKRMAERLSAMGHTPESGVYEMAMQELDREFDQQRSGAQNQLALNDLSRREDRAQRAEMIGGQLADIPDARAREQLDVYSALDRLSSIAREEEAARSREAIQYGGVLSDLGPNRLNLAMQAAGMGGNPASLGSLLTGIAGLNQDASQLNQMNSASWQNALGQVTAILMRSRNAGLSGAGI